MFVPTKAPLSSPEWELFHGKNMLWTKTLLMWTYYLPGIVLESRDVGVNKTLNFLLMAHPRVTWPPCWWHAFSELRRCDLKLAPCAEGRETGRPFQTGKWQFY